MTTVLPYGTIPEAVLCEEMARVIARGGMVGVPTETFYGLAVNPFDPLAVTRLIHAKGRADGKPILVLIGEQAQLTQVTDSITPAAARLMEAFWPGPLTILFPAKPSLPAVLTAGTGTIGVRLTSCLVLQGLLRSVGPVTGTSANRSGAPPATTAAQVVEAMGETVDLIIDGGPTPGGAPSTVVEIQESVRIVRKGAVPKSLLQQVLQPHGHR
ncbi:MAG: L-threonylcarbamoyladenylate synthase, partial [Nitrospira sp.]